MAIKKIAKRAFPLHTRRGRVLKQTAAALRLAKPLQYSQKYQHWIDHVEKEMFLPVVRYKKTDKPLFSIVIPFYNTKQKYLPALFDSIVNQSFDDWELIAADGSSDSEISQYIKQLCDQDSRIKYYKFTKYTDISGNTNQGLEKATGEYIVFCDHDDVLSLHALNEVAAVLRDDSSTDIVYTDEDKLTENGKHRQEPFFKPDWSPHLYMYTNYTNHLSVVRRKLVNEAQGLRPEYNGAQDYDLLLRIHATNEDLNVHHIPKVLYYWRQAEGSTAINMDSKSYAFDAGRRSLEEYITAKGLSGSVEFIDDRPGYYRVILQPTTIKKVLVVAAISTSQSENDGFLEKMKSLTATELKVNYVSVKPDGIDTVKKDEYDAVFEFTQVCYPESADWLDRLAGVLELNDVADVSPRILSADGLKISDMGIVYGPAGEEVNLFKCQRANDLTLYGHVEWVRDVDALSGAVRAYRTKKTTSIKHHHVVWSNVNFRHYPVFGGESMFNQNLYVSKKGKIKLNDL